MSDVRKCPWLISLRFDAHISLSAGYWPVRLSKSICTTLSVLNSVEVYNTATFISLLLQLLLARPYWLSTLFKQWLFLVLCSCPVSWDFAGIRAAITSLWYRNLLFYILCLKFIFVAFSFILILFFGLQREMGRDTLYIAGSTPSSRASVCSF